MILHRSCPLLPFLCLVTALVLGSGPVAAGQATDSSACSALAKLRLPDTVIESATLKEAGAFHLVSPPVAAPGEPPPSPRESSFIPLPAYCKVKATVKGSIAVEVWLPLRDWNGRFQGVGNGGTAGSIGYAAMAQALHRGYAVAATNTGHINKPPNLGFDAQWAHNRPDLVDDWAYLAIHLMTETGRSVVKAFYNDSPRRSYFVGCSRGGAQALLEAQRYPDDYDGIVAGDPANDSTAIYTGAHLWYAVATLKDPESYIPREKIPLLADEVNRQCDQLDGLKDGILNDPRKCKVDLQPITCRAGSEEAKCLTPKQAKAVQDIWSGVRDGAGQQIFPGLVPGAEAGPMGWAVWVTGWAPKTSQHYLAGDQFFKYLVNDDPNYDPFTFDFATGYAGVRSKLHARLDADNPDLRPFLKHGGKLILYHGWSDPDLSPLNTIHYYTEVQKAVGPSTPDSIRLFMVPGMQHCENGPGATHFDAVTALEEWSESGIAPSQMLASHLTGNTVDMTRPLCPYPQVATFSGKGSPNNALNFTCADPK